MSSLQSQDRLQQLQEIEKEIVKVVSSAGHALQEISQEQPNHENLNTHTREFLNSLQGVEKGLLDQITYLTEVATGQPHEGSIYGAEKDFALTCQGTKIAKQRLTDLVQEFQNGT
ncbi:mediator of RNA polymerase II transcription subunit 11-like [Dendronephthya gigantea]|uniref:mediator of RNA polymerase II transcription subunit 11-like n=1 Tax=Dendronephthya gigantea TaxID=151771 RepID=UPI00106DA8FF|nr:mediator of RNA polymerase II transcription subunit 11-like [Dendronephthya gigantea]XP_028395513.1 mediator of RNA polymerase II transcription subunit 11-like [Dendronephthya gigantea]